MNDPMKQAKERYHDVQPPEELPATVAGAIRRGEKERSRRRAVRRSLSTVLAACACFVLLLNVSPSFAGAVSEVPLLGSIARIFTITQYSVTDEEHLIDVRLPALSDTGNTDLEQRINTEIQTCISDVIDEAEQRSREAREAYIATGGVEDDFIPVIIDVDYEIKCQNDQYLSFIITETETQASAYTQLYTYNIDLETGKQLTLRDLLGSDWKSICNQAVISGMAQRTAEDPEQIFFDGSDGITGFESIREDQPFFINTAGNPVVIFEKYEIAPGFMGEQEFEIIP